MNESINNAHCVPGGSAASAASPGTDPVPTANATAPHRGRRGARLVHLSGGPGWSARLGRRVGAAPAVLPVVVMLGASPVYHPDASTAPGKAVVQDLLNTVAFYCLALALAAFAVGAATWGIGGRMMHSGAGAAAGKMTMLAAVGGAILLGAGPAIIAWALQLGGKA
jgi:hypothetical protein